MSASNELLLIFKKAVMASPKGGAIIVDWLSSRLNSGVFAIARIAYRKINFTLIINSCKMNMNIIKGFLTCQG